jgi:hypothetical protein
MKRNFGKLKYDTNKEEGEVELSEYLPKDVVGLDILQDWINLLTVEYDTRVQEVFSRQRKTKCKRL